jgi:hypothetical protein
MVAATIFGARGAEGVAQQLSLWPGYARGSVGKVEVRGSIVYALHDAGLLIQDVSAPASPRELSLLPIEHLMDFAMLGNYVFASHLTGSRGSTNLLIIDVSDPTQPRVANTFGTEFYAQKIFVAGKYIYLREDGYLGLQVLDATDPVNPTNVGRWYINQSYNTAYCFSGNLAYMTLSSDNFFYVYDVSDPSQPKFLGSCVSKYSSSEIFAQGNYAYVARDQGLDVIDVTDPAAPRKVGDYSISNYGFAAHIFVSGNYAYLTSDQFGSSGVGHIFDVSDPTAPKRLGPIGDIVGTLGRPVVSSSNLFIPVKYSGSGAGLQIFSLTDPAAPLRIAGPIDNGDSYDVAVANGVAYWADDVLRTMDVSNPRAPQLISTIGSVIASTVAVSDTYAVIGRGPLATTVYDVTDPTAPVGLGSLNTSSSLTKTLARGRTAYLLERDGSVFDIMDFSVAKPVRLGAWSTNGYFLSGLAITDNLAYIAAQAGGLFVLDIANPAAIQVQGRVANITAHDVALKGSVAFVAADQLEAIDVSATANPHSIASLAIDADLTNIVVSGNYCLLSSDWNTTVVDISDPANMRMVQKLDFGGCMKVDGNKVYFTQKVWGLRIAEITEPVRVGVRRAGNGWELFWPGATAPTFRLVHTEALNGATWQDFVPAPTLVGDEWRAPIAIDKAHHFYKLISD